MPCCPTCSAELPSAGAACPACALATATATRPVHLSGLLQTLTRGVDRPPPADADFRFTPGTVLSDRYRLVAPLGKGGMGEVYRADDLTLGQSVALKFLPDHVKDHPATLDRFRKEVAAARQVAHPHVCRVFDIGETGGQVFLSMEFIPGDDLAGVLRKAGRLSSGLAIDLARQVAAGLQAVHDEGLVHRDLKPANVMVDGKGRARLTDFGLAATSASISANDAFSGTPAYQAPEQLGGRTISERTDVYALGLLAYELLTGRRPFDATDRKGLIEQQRDTKPPAPSLFDPTIPPEVDRIVLKCLAFDPKDRPTSAHEVWRTLPGDEALNRALAAGVTPSAEAVADAGGEGRLKRWVAVFLTGMIIGVTILGALYDQSRPEVRITEERPPEELRHRCRDILARVNHPEESRYAEATYPYDEPVIRLADWLNSADLGASRTEPAVSRRFTTTHFLYRESDRPLTPTASVAEYRYLSTSDPPFVGPGDAIVRLDGQGRLLVLKRILPVPRPDTTQPADWSALATAAELDLAALRPVDPESQWTIPHDARYAWLGSYPDCPSVPVRIEAAADHGEVVGFLVISPGTSPESGASPEEEYRQNGRVLFLGLPSLILPLCGWISYRNLRSGVADLRGTVRFVVAFALLRIGLEAFWYFRSWPAGMTYADLVLVVGQVVLNVLWVGAAYLALEPFVRRKFPGQLTGWQRLLSGRVTSPHLGREVLLGLWCGAASILILMATMLAAHWLGQAERASPSSTHRLSEPVTNVFDAVSTSVNLAFCFQFVVCGLTWLMRTPRLSLPALIALVLLGIYFFSPIEEVWMRLTVGLCLAAVALLTLWKFGLVALMSALLYMNLTSFLILEGWASAFWFAPALGWAVFLSLTLYALVVSVGGWRRLVWGEKAG